MVMKTRITELLGIEHPIIQGGMAWVAEHNLAEMCIRDRPGFHAALVPGYSDV